jgi:hypothetical protein
MCVTAHALLAALVSRLESGGPDARADELIAIVGAGCPRADVEATLRRTAGESAARALALLDRTQTPERTGRTGRGGQ